MSEMQKARQDERKQLIEMIVLKYGSLRRFCDLVGYKYSRFRLMLTRNPISDWQIGKIRQAYGILMSTPNQKLDDEIRASDLDLIERTMKLKGVSQNKLSKELGVARTTLGDLLRGGVKKKTDLYHKVTNYLNI